MGLLGLQFALGRVQRGRDCVDFLIFLREEFNIEVEKFSEFVDRLLLHQIVVVLERKPAVESMLIKLTSGSGLGQCSRYLLDQFPLLVAGKDVT